LLDVSASLFEYYARNDAEGSYRYKMSIMPVLMKRRRVKLQNSNHFHKNKIIIVENLYYLKEYL
jgi:hypothetical protein